jgi:hypothetical protein
LIACCLAAAGGILIFEGYHWNASIALSLFAVLTIGPFFIASLLGLVGLVLLVLSRDEFTALEHSYGPELIGRETNRAPPTDPR